MPMSTPVRDVSLGRIEADFNERSDGTMIVRSTAALPPYPKKITVRLDHIEHALLALAALYVGVPYAPISPPYALVSSDFGKLRHVLGLLTPGLVFAADRKS